MYFRGLLVYNSIAVSMGAPVIMDLWYLMFAKVRGTAGIGQYRCMHDSRNAGCGGMQDRRDAGQKGSKTGL